MKGEEQPVYWVVQRGGGAGREEGRGSMSTLM